MSRLLLVLLATLAPSVSGATHNLFVGNLSPPAAIYALEFNDKTNEFKIANNNTASASHAWITFDGAGAKRNIYATSLNASQIASYRVTSPTSVELVKTIPGYDACANTTSAFIVAKATPPYFAFTASWPGPNGCGMAIGTDVNGSLTQVIDSWSYRKNSAIHGLALGPPNAPYTENGTEQLLYSADLSGDTIWTHTLSTSTVNVAPLPVQISVAQKSHLVLPQNGTHPRHLTVHPSGTSLYVVNEADNSLTQFALSPTTGAPTTQIFREFLIPADANPNEYWSAEVMLGPAAASSANATNSWGGQYLWATARAKRKEAHGYINVFLLDAAGGITKRLFRVETTTGGGSANAISPAFWDPAYAAMTDYSNGGKTGYVQMWKMTGGVQGENGWEYETLKPVAKVDINDGGCCANVIWYS